MTEYVGGGLRALSEHERTQIQQDADAYRAAGDALIEAYDDLSASDPRLRTWGKQLLYEAEVLEGVKEMRVR